MRVIIDAAVFSIVCSVFLGFFMPLPNIIVPAVMMGVIAAVMKGWLEYKI